MLEIPFVEVTTTPHGSPLRRKLSTKPNIISIEDNQEEIENELRTRRLEAINKSTELRRRSAAPPLLAGLNLAQLADHCRDCIKLSTENKINSKNAFNLLLIDFMAAMTKKNDSEISQNFQVASCTLDASVKIYGYRVDAVHTDAMKIAGGFIGKDAQDLGEDDGEKNEGEGEKVSVKAKRKKRRRKMNLVSANSITLKGESEALLNMDPGPNMLSRHGDGSRLLTRIPKEDDDCALVVNAEGPCCPYDCEPKTDMKISETFDLEEIMSVVGDCDINLDDKLCAAASSIELGKDEEEHASELELSQTSACEFDMNASVRDVSEDEANESAPRPLTVPCSGYDSGEEIALPCKPIRSFHAAALIEMKSKLSVNNMEYTMFDEKLFKAWAGPTYWKVRPSRVSSEENKENEDASRPVAVKRTRKGKVKEKVGLFEVDDNVMARQLEQTEKTILAKSTLNNWKASSVTLADDYKYSPKELFSLFYLPLFVVKRREENSRLEDVLDEPEAEEEDGPAEELEYCSQLFPDNNDEQMDTDGDAGNMSTPAIETWDSVNMVAVPNKVKQINVGSFMRKKYVDIKHLKRCIWSTLTNEEADRENLTVTDPTTFSDLIKTCQSKLSRSASGCISAPLIFNALLHLTNEKSLVLNQPKKQGDIFISQ